MKSNYKSVNSPYLFNESVEKKTNDKNKSHMKILNTDNNITGIFIKKN